MNHKSATTTNVAPYVKISDFMCRSVLWMPWRLTSSSVGKSSAVISRINRVETIAKSPSLKNSTLSLSMKFPNMRSNSDPVRCTRVHLRYITPARRLIQGEKTTIATTIRANSILAKLTAPAKIYRKGLTAFFTSISFILCLIS